MKTEALLQIAKAAEKLSFNDMGSLTTCAIHEGHKLGLIRPAERWQSYPGFGAAAQCLDIERFQAEQLFNGGQNGAQCAAQIRRFCQMEMG